MSKGPVAGRRVEGGQVEDQYHQGDQQSQLQQAGGGRSGGQVGWLMSVEMAVKAERKFVKPTYP